MVRIVELEIAPGAEPLRDDGPWLEALENSPQVETITVPTLLPLKVGYLGPAFRYRNFVATGEFRDGHEIFREKA